MRTDCVQYLEGPVFTALEDSWSLPTDLHSQRYIYGESCIVVSNVFFSLFAQSSAKTFSVPMRFCLVKAVPTIRVFVHHFSIPFDCPRHKRHCTFKTVRTLFQFCGQVKANMHGAKRKRGDVSPSPTPRSISSATPAETDSRPSTLSPDPEDYSQKHPKVSEAFACWPNARKVTREEVQKMQSFRETPDVLDARDRQAHIYANTRRMMHVRTKRMLALALRDYQRHHHVPTRRTKPPLHKRRYSIDVHKGFDRDRVKRARDRRLIERFQGATQERPWEFESVPTHHELERAPFSTPPLGFPNPARFVEFQYRDGAFTDPPFTDDTYLSHELVSITNKQWHYMLHTTGEECWMQDDGLDASLSVLAASTNCAANGITVGNSVDTQLLYRDLASAQQNSAAKFLSATWIFIPLNDGIDAASNANANGSHWSLLAFDRPHRHCHYFDSTGVHDTRRSGLARIIFERMCVLLGERAWSWRAHPETNTPLQHRDNLFRADDGPCAPFVYSMVRYLVDKVHFHLRAGSAEQMWFNLPDGFPAWWAQWWDSYAVRVEMQRSVALAKMDGVAARLIGAHDDAALPQGVQVSDEPLRRVLIPPCYGRTLDLENDDEWPALRRASSPVETSDVERSDVETSDVKDGRASSVSTLDADEGVPSTSLAGDQEVYTIRCIGYDAGVVSTTATAAQEDGWG
ncbi:uncharacterized protein M421DRAFT_94645 [Didymella exigua CBS 183.55]|uniref:Ubiquitin-like protease family profile domain-containing protein n=1 Tax=Didymella exigua CBS 183.55 TaxID=1150837 RepID=A0A6A5RGD6_9PLEO|nr:uncharacterized protein M421DRAFT_94645 [Didymella exigua CBS 183.55]KAF1925566.1 hypothetical protein M421DRAFT_94645 [Didymella exigua CBS 183.55]